MPDSGGVPPEVDADVRQIVVHSRNQVLETETDFKVETLKTPCGGDC